MNTNSPKRHQVVSAKNHRHNTDKQKTKSDKVDEISCSGNNETLKCGGYFSFCKENAQQCCEEQTLQSLNCSTDSGNICFLIGNIY